MIIPTAPADPWSVAERPTPINPPNRHPRSMSRSAVLVLVAGLATLVAALSVGTYVILTKNPASVEQHLGEAPTSSVPVDPEVQRGCAAVKWEPGQTTDVTKDPTAMKAAGQAAGRASVTDVRAAGDELALRAELARVAVGSYNEFATSLAMQTAMLNLRAACLRAGY